MQRRVARKLQHVITVSESSATQITDHLGVPASRQVVIPVGTDIDHFSPDPNVPRVPGRIVTTASADVPLKGLVPLIEAIAKVRTERPVDLVVIGTARRGGPVLDLVERYSLGDAVRFTGRVSDEDSVHYLRSAELAVVPSLFEGFSLPAIEAMACATPVVTTTGGALPEVVGPDGLAALLVAPGDPQAMADESATRSTIRNACPDGCRRPGPGGAALHLDGGRPAHSGGLPPRDRDADQVTRC